MRRAVKRSLLLKFVLSFALVIFASALIIVFSIRISTRSQYTKVINQNDMQRAEELAAVFASLYQENGNWESIVPLFDHPAPDGRQTGRGRMRRPGPHMEDAGSMYLRMLGQRFRIVLTDENNRVLADSRALLLGETLPAAAVKRGMPVEIENSIVGRIYVGTMIEPVLTSVDQAFLNSVNRGVFFAAFTGLVLSFLVTMFFFRRITAPVLSLSAASKNIAEGDYSVEVEESGNDELADLAKSFNNMTRALQRGDEWKKQIIADAAHELRTPVSLIKANLEMMLEGVYPIERQQLVSIHSETEKLSTLITELQALSSAEAGTLFVKREELSITALIGKVVPLFELSAQEKQVKIRKNEIEGVYSVAGDEVKLSQVFSNILSNALRFSPVNGVIEITLSAESKGVKISVEDQGPGIPKQDLERVFERFYKVDKSRNQGGSGLGLAISREIIHAHGGKMWAESDGVSGTRVTIFLPSQIR